MTQQLHPTVAAFMCQPAAVVPRGWQRLSPWRSLDREPRPPSQGTSGQLFERRRRRLIPNLMKQADDRRFNPLRSAAVSLDTDFLEQLVDVERKLVGAELREVVAHRSI